MILFVGQIMALGLSPHTVAMLPSVLVHCMASTKFQVMSGDRRSTLRMKVKRTIETAVTLDSDGKRPAGGSFE